MNVSAIIVTRGNVDLQPVLDSLPPEWERIVWDNGKPEMSWNRKQGSGRISGSTTAASDLSVYGRYAAIEYASHDLIYVQDDDVIVSDPLAIVEEWVANLPHIEVGMLASGGNTPYEGIVANMPQEFRHDGYTDSCLVGFGACFHRDAPRKAFERWEEWRGEGDSRMVTTPDFWNRTCDVVFTTLTPRVLVDVPKVNLDYAYGDDRMWKQPNHVGERARMLELARKVRDA